MQAAQQQKERGEQTAENVRYGEALSEHGFGGETTTNSGQSGQGKLHRSLRHPSQFLLLL